MESKRQAKYSRLIQKDLSEIFLREGKHLFGKQFIGVSAVRVTPDMSYVKVYLTFLNEKEPQNLLALIRSHNKEIRNMLAVRIRNTVRKIPELEFFYDDTMDYVEKMDKIFSTLHTPTAEEQQEERHMDEDKKND